MVCIVGFVLFIFERSFVINRCPFNTTLCIPMALLVAAAFVVVVASVSFSLFRKLKTRRLLFRIYSMAIWIFFRIFPDFLGFI